MQSIIEAAKIMPVEDKILLIPAERKQYVSAVGLELADNAKDTTPIEGTIDATGPDSRYSVGDRVLFGRYAGTELRLGEKDYILMSDSAVLALLC